MIAGRGSIFTTKCPGSGEPDINCELSRFAECALRRETLSLPLVLITSSLIAATSTSSSQVHCGLFVGHVIQSRLLCLKEAEAMTLRSVRTVGRLTRSIRYTQQERDDARVIGPQCLRAKQSGRGGSHLKKSREWSPMRPCPNESKELDFRGGFDARMC
jgi:hypothetical protein